ncbi:MAG: NfeD family protein [Geobacteraceae bacterium]|nr:NfeD family protein [Geobacteraceae bacterium]
MNILWWHWVVMGLILIGLELVIPSFTIVWFGLGAVLVGIIVGVVPGLPVSAQIFSWTIFSAGLTFAWFRFFKPRTKTLSGSSKDAVLGERGLVVKAAGTYDKGRVRFPLPVLGADEWACMSDEPLEVGDRVRIVDVEGHLLKVEKTEKGEKQ